MYKIGIVGDRESVLGFMALGFSVFEAETAPKAEEQLKKAADSGQYAVIFLVEKYAVELADTIARYKDCTLPAVTVIPGRSGSAGYGMAAIKDAVERAVGADILFKE